MTDQLLPAVLVDKARQVVEANLAAGRRVAVAESCTGGLVSAALTEIPGASDVFEAGYVTYSNASKIGGLKISEDVVDTFGAVSIATAWAMARGALEASGRRRRGGDYRDCRARRRNPHQADRDGHLRARRARWPIPTMWLPTASISTRPGGAACGFRRRSARSTC